MCQNYKDKQEYQRNRFTNFRWVEGLLEYCVACLPVLQYTEDESTPMFPVTPVPWYLCSSEPMFPISLCSPYSHVPRYICSPWVFMLGPLQMSQHLVPNVPISLRSSKPMFLRTHISHIPIFLGTSLFPYVPPYLTYPFPHVLPNICSLVPNFPIFLCSLVHMFSSGFNSWLPLHNVLNWILKKILNYRAVIVLGNIGMTPSRPILLEQHQNQQNCLKILLDCIITTGINLLKPSVTQTVEQLSVELRVTPCRLPWSQNTAGSHFCFEKFPQKKFN